MTKKFDYLLSKGKTALLAIKSKKGVPKSVNLTFGNRFFR